MPRNPKSSDPIMRAFAQELRMARAISGLTSEEAAVQAGITYGSYVRWIEAGHGTKLAHAIKLARFFGISLDNLYGIDAGKGKEVT